MSQTMQHPPRILVLGGTGFVGMELCRQGLALGWQIVAVSRRGPPSETLENKLFASVSWEKGDATQAGVIEQIIKTKGPFTAVFHAIGALFDGSSSLRSLNAIISGAGSVVDEGVTYDDLTRKTAFALLAAAESSCAPQTAYVFLSAAEAGWPNQTCGSFIDKFVAPNFLQRYLTAKRAVEAKLLDSDRIRSVILRPSFIWTWRKLDILVPVCLYSILQCLPFIDRPVRVEMLVAAAIAAIEQPSVSGVLDSNAMRMLAASALKIQ